MKYLVAHTYIPSESAAVYPRASDYAIRDSSKEAFDFAEKQLADMKETYETEYGQQCIAYTVCWKSHSDSGSSCESNAVKKVS